MSAKSEGTLTLRFTGSRLMVPDLKSGGSIRSMAEYGGKSDPGTVVLAAFVKMRGFNPSFKQKMRDRISNSLFKLA